MRFSTAYAPMGQIFNETGEHIRETDLIQNCTSSSPTQTMPADEILNSTNSEHSIQDIATYEVLNAAQFGQNIQDFSAFEVVNPIRFGQNFQHLTAEAYVNPTHFGQNSISPRPLADEIPSSRFCATLPQTLAAAGQASQARGPLLAELPPSEI